MAVKVLEIPGQIGPAGTEEILTAGTTIEFTIIPMLFELTIVGEAQLAVEVILQLTISPFASDEFV